MNPVEWSKAQELLLQLVHALSPLAKRPPHSDLVPNNWLFIPRKGEGYPASQVRNPVQILSTLESVQKQVHEWVGEGKGESTFKEKEIASIARQAERIILRVRKTIGKLISSDNIKAQKDPFLAAMKSIEPELAEIIKAVAQEELETARKKPAERSFGVFPRFLPTPSAREALILKKKVVEEKKVMKRGDAPHFFQAPKEVVERQTPIARNEETPIPAESLKRTSHQEKLPISQDPPILSQKAKLSPVIQAGSVIQPQEKEPAAPRPMEKTTIAAAPFVSEIRSLTPARKKKKKKGFWHRAEEDDDLKNS